MLKEEGKQLGLVIWFQLILKVEEGQREVGTTRAQILETVPPQRMVS